MKKLTILGLAICCIANASQAAGLPFHNPDYDAANPTASCYSLHVQITNKTNANCVLQGHSLNHGTLLTGLPDTIPVNGTKSLDLVQDYLFGPDLDLAYQCGADKIVFSSQQDYCYYNQGAVRGDLVEPFSPIITATSTTSIGSRVAHEAGRISWSIAPRV